MDDPFAWFIVGMLTGGFAVIFMLVFYLIRERNDG